MSSKLPKSWQETTVVSVAPLSEERVSPFKGDRQYLATGGMDETYIGQLKRVSYEDRPTRADLVVRTGDVIVARMKETLKVLEILPEKNGLIVSTGFAVFRPTPKILSGYLYFFLRSSIFQGLKDKYAQGSTQKAINNTALKTIKLPLPPIPVQERIVQILQKADEIRHKREEAMELADAILPASFIGMFGDPGNNHDDFEHIPLGQIADVRSGVTKGRKLHGKKTVEAPYLRVANVQDGFFDLTEVRTIEVLPGDLDKYRLDDGDILIIEGCGTPQYLGRGCIWRGEIEGCIHQNHIFRVRANRALILPEYLASLLRTKYANQYFLSCAKNSSGLANINSTQVKALSVPLPSIKIQEKFVSAVEQWVQASDRLTVGLKDARKLFTGMLDESFTGQLTSEWEAANAEEISALTAFNERLPRLLVLTLLAEKANHAKQKAAEVLVTALMKYVFLLQMEGNGQRRLYNFIPYHYGPFAKELYTDLEKLKEDGLVIIENDSEEDKIKITLADSAKVEQALGELPDDLKEDIAVIIDAYGDLNHNSLLKLVYEKYPAYAKKSRLRKGRSKKR